MCTFFLFRFKYFVISKFVKELWVIMLNINTNIMFNIKICMKIMYQKIFLTKVYIYLFIKVNIFYVIKYFILS